MRVRLNAPKCNEDLVECSVIQLNENELILKFVAEPGRYHHVTCRSGAEAQGLFEEACETGYVDLRGFQYGMR